MRTSSSLCFYVPASTRYNPTYMWPVMVALSRSLCLGCCMARSPTLSFDRGTLILHPPPPGKAWIDYAVWDDRVERFRIPALYYRRLVAALTAEGTTLVDSAREFSPLTLVPALEMTPYPHQREALAAWIAAGRLGVVVLPTGAGKTYLAQLAMQA